MSVLAILLIFLPFPVLSFFLAWFGFIKTPSYWKYMFPFYLYGVFFLAYSLIPDHTLDMNRYFWILEDIQGLSLGEAIEVMHDNLLVENILFWLVAQTGLFHLLPAITTCVVYGVGAYITYDCSEKRSYRYGWMIILLQFVMIPFLTVASNIRNVFAFSLIVMAAYLDLVKKRRNLLVWILYIAPIFIHKTGIIIVIVRLLVPVFKRMMPVALALIVGLPTLITFAYSHISFFSFGGRLGSIVRTLIRSSASYLQGESEYAERVRNSTGQAVSRLVVFSSLFVILFCYLWQFYRNKQETDFEVFGYMLCILSLAMNAIDTPAYWRFASATFLAVPPLLYRFYRNELFRKRTTIIISLLIFVYLAGRYALYLKINIPRINLNETMEQMLISNAYTILYQLIRNLFWM